MIALTFVDTSGETLFNAYGLIAPRVGEFIALGERQWQVLFVRHGFAEFFSGGPNPNRHLIVLTLASVE